MLANAVDTIKTTISFYVPCPFMSWTRHKFLSFLVSSSSFTIPQHTVPPSIRTCSTATSPFAFNMPCECQLFQTLFPHYVFKNFYRYLRDPSSFPIYLRLLRNLRAPSMIFSVSYDTTTFLSSPVFSHSVRKLSSIHCDTGGLTLHGNLSFFCFF